LIFYLLFEFYTGTLFDVYVVDLFRFWPLSELLLVFMFYQTFVYVFVILISRLLRDFFFEHFGAIHHFTFWIYAYLYLPGMFDEPDYFDSDLYTEEDVLLDPVPTEFPASSNRWADPAPSTDYDDEDIVTKRRRRRRFPIPFRTRFAHYRSNHPNLEHDEADITSPSFLWSGRNIEWDFYVNSDDTVFLEDHTIDWSSYLWVHHVHTEWLLLLLVWMFQYCVVLFFIRYFTRFFDLNKFRYIPYLNHPLGSFSFDPYSWKIRVFVRKLSWLMRNQPWNVEVYLRVMHAEMGVLEDSTEEHSSWSWASLKPTKDVQTILWSLYDGQVLDDVYENIEETEDDFFGAEPTFAEDIDFDNVFRNSTDGVWDNAYLNKENSNQRYLYWENEEDPALEFGDEEEDEPRMDESLDNEAVLGPYNVDLVLDYYSFSREDSEEGFFQYLFWRYKWSLVRAYFEKEGFEKAGSSYRIYYNMFDGAMLDRIDSVYKQVYPRPYSDLLVFRPLFSDKGVSWFDRYVDLGWIESHYVFGENHRALPDSLDDSIEDFFLDAEIEAILETELLTSDEFDFSAWKQALFTYLSFCDNLISSYGSGYNYERSLREFSQTFPVLGFPGRLTFVSPLNSRDFPHLAFFQYACFRTFWEGLQDISEHQFSGVFSVLRARLCNLRYLPASMDVDNFIIKSFGMEQDPVLDGYLEAFSNGYLNFVSCKYQLIFDLHKPLLSCDWTTFVSLSPLLWYNKEVSQLAMWFPFAGSQGVVFFDEVKDLILSENDLVNFPEYNLYHGKDVSYLKTGVPSSVLDMFFGEFYDEERLYNSSSVMSSVSENVSLTDADFAVVESQEDSLFYSNSEFPDVIFHSLLDPRAKVNYEYDKWVYFDKVWEDVSSYAQLHSSTPAGSNIESRLWLEDLFFTDRSFAKSTFLSDGVFFFKPFLFTNKSDVSHERLLTHSQRDTSTDRFLKYYYDELLKFGAPAGDSERSFWSDWYLNFCYVRLSLKEYLVSLFSRFGLFEYSKEEIAATKADLSKIVSFNLDTPHFMAWNEYKPLSSIEKFEHMSAQVLDMELDTTSSSFSRQRDMERLSLVLNKPLSSFYGSEAQELSKYQFLSSSEKLSLYKNIYLEKALPTLAILDDFRDEHLNNAFKLISKEDFFASSMDRSLCHILTGREHLDLVSLEDYASFEREAISSEWFFASTLDLSKAGFDKLSHVPSISAIYDASYFASKDHSHSMDFLYFNVENRLLHLDHTLVSDSFSKIREENDLAIDAAAGKNFIDSKYRYKADGLLHESLFSVSPKLFLELNVFLSQRGKNLSYPFISQFLRYRVMFLIYTYYKEYYKSIPNYLSFPEISAGSSGRKDVSLLRSSLFCNLSSFYDESLFSLSKYSTLSVDSVYKTTNFGLFLDSFFVPSLCVSNILPGLSGQTSYFFFSNLIESRSLALFDEFSVYEFEKQQFGLGSPEQAPYAFGYLSSSTWFWLREVEDDSLFSFEWNPLFFTTFKLYDESLVGEGIDYDPDDESSLDVNDVDDDEVPKFS
jgi:hypothetical protein